MIAFFFAFFISTQVNAANNGSWYIGTGILNQNISKVATDASDQTSFLGNSYYLPIQMKTYFGALFGLQTMLKAMYTVLPRTTPDGGAQTSMLLLAAPMVYRLSQKWDIDFGLSWLLYIIRGQGGTKSLNNGAGMTTYGLPARYQMTENLIFEMGTSFTTHSSNIGLDILIESPLSNRRAFSVLLSYNYRFAGT